MPQLTGQSARESQRNPDQTRQMLLDAATQAFAESGLAGVRVDQVARSAGVNKAMIYHYFGDKQGLYDAVVEANSADLRAPSTMAELGDWQQALSAQLSPQRLRLLAWEGLRNGQASIDEHSVQDYSAQRPNKPNDRLGRAQQDTSDLALVLLALSAFPQLCPQAARSLTGMDPGTEAFQTHWTKVQARLLRLVESATRGGKERVRLQPASKPAGDG